MTTRPLLDVRQSLVSSALNKVLKRLHSPLGVLRN